MWINKTLNSILSAPSGKKCKISVPIIWEIFWNFQNWDFSLFKPIPLWVMIIQTSKFFWKFTLKAECSKIGTISDFWLYLPYFFVLQENIRFVLKTSLTKLSNEYKNIIIPQWNDWENWVWIRAADFIDVACNHS